MASALLDHGLIVSDLLFITGYQMFQKRACYSAAIHVTFRIFCNQQMIPNSFWHYFQPLGNRLTITVGKQVSVSTRKSSGQPRSPAIKVEIQ